uniref:Uncharacterized protein n=1 Tax=Crocodylus porosus TaxID=8502 RepID=A0A7M4ED79_CROPO
IGMLGRLDRVQHRHSLMIPEQRSLNLFTKKPPRKVPPPPAGTTRQVLLPHAELIEAVRAWVESDHLKNCAVSREWVIIM